MLAFIWSFDPFSCSYDRMNKQQFDRERLDEAMNMDTASSKHHRPSRVNSAGYRRHDNPACMDVDGN